MEKGQESKQKRKTPLTTIAISQEYAQKLDEESLPFLLVGSKVEKTFSVCIGQPSGLQNTFQL